MSIQFKIKFKIKPDSYKDSGIQVVASSQGSGSKNGDKEKKIVAYSERSGSEIKSSELKLIYGRPK